MIKIENNFVKIPIEEILKRLNDDDWWTRSCACYESKFICKDIPLEEILKRLTDENPHVRSVSCKIFGPAREDIPLEEVLKNLTIKIGTCVLLLVKHFYLIDAIFLPKKF